MTEKTEEQKNREFAQELIDEENNPVEWMVERLNEALYEAFDWDHNDRELDALQDQFAEIVGIAEMMREMTPTPELV